MCVLTAQQLKIISICKVVFTFSDSNSLSFPTHTYHRLNHLHHMRFSAEMIIPHSKLTCFLWNDEWLTIVLIKNISDSSGIENDNVESGIGTATPPKDQVCLIFLLERLRFLSKMLGFLIKTLGFLIKTLGFLIKTPVLGLKPFFPKNITFTPKISPFFHWNPLKSIKTTW